MPPSRRCGEASVRVLVPVLLALLVPASGFAQAPVEYRLSFTEPEHRLMDVEVRFQDIPAGALEVRMSRSSPGRYALHEFARNVFDVRITDSSGVALPVARPNPISGSHRAPGAVRVTYRIFATFRRHYSRFDSTHAHINMPAR